MVGKNKIPMKEMPGVTLVTFDVPLGVYDIESRGSIVQTFPLHIPKPFRRFLVYLHPLSELKETIDGGDTFSLLCIFSLAIPICL